MIKIDIKKELNGSNGNMNLEINLEIEEGEFIAISGKSGSGKTTFLRILAGLEESAGEIIIGNKIWLNHKKFLPPQKRKIGFVFQDYALFSNMNVEENLLFVNKDKNLANRLLEITELSNMKKRLPHSLSGGQKQRVSLCRALMNKPKLLLLDEPLSALDPVMRTKLQNDISLLHKEFNLTTMMISHDYSEIYKLSNRVIEIENGKIINNGNAKDILVESNKNKLSFEGEVVDIIEIDMVKTAIISIGQQLIELILEEKSKDLKIGQRIRIDTDIFIHK